MKYKEYNIYLDNHYIYIYIYILDKRWSDLNSILCDGVRCRTTVRYTNIKMMSV